MNTISILETIGIKKPSSKIINNPKIIQLVNLINEENKDIYETGLDIKEDAFLILIENINSLNKLLKIIKNIALLLSIDFEPMQIAKFYNIYDPDTIQYSEELLILIDDEYLKYASLEWTTNNLLKQEKVLYIENNKCILKDNPNELDSMEYISSFLLNVDALKVAKEKGLLKEAIMVLS